MLNKRIKWTDVCAFCGALVWVLMPLLTGKGVEYFHSVHWLVILCPLVIVPLSLTPAGIASAPSWISGSLMLVLLPCSLGAATAICIFSENADIAVPLTVPWVMCTFLLSFLGVSRRIKRPSRAIEESAIDVGFFYLPVGALWLYASVSGMTPMGFTEPIVILTAAHFHFAGFAAPLIAGFCGRGLWFRMSSRFAKRLHWKCTFAVIFAPILIAMGISYSPLLEFIAATALCVALVGIALFLIFLPRRNLFSRILCLISGLSVCMTMLFAFFYAFGEWLENPILSIPEMLEWHGAFNALVFAFLGMLGLRLDNAPSRAPELRAPFSRLKGGWYIGADIFDRIKAYDSNKKKPSGLFDDRQDLEKEGFEPSIISPVVADFYEKTKDYRIFVRPKWSRWIRWSVGLFRNLTHSWQQLNLPLHPVSESEMRSEILPLSDKVDGRQNVRAWVRTYIDSWDVVYAAAYSMHRSRRVPYMNIAFPLLWGQMTSLLQIDHLEASDGGLRLSTLSNPDLHGEQGVYYVRGSFVMRLPVNETIEVAPAPAPESFAFEDVPGEVEDYTVVARHQMWLWGFKFLVLEYWLSPEYAEDF